MQEKSVLEQMLYTRYELENESYCQIVLALSTTGNTSRPYAGGDERVLSVHLCGPQSAKRKYDKVRLIGKEFAAEESTVLNEARFALVSPLPRVESVEVRRRDDGVWVPMLVRHPLPILKVLLSQADTEILTWQNTPCISG